ncbi:DEAD/DEAH box helicase [uncultured Thomasclavelia sp.]|uniref:DEAD/DEAH box helicase n=1 Tax=uncultured Thomasclavelia sp. TaxID=3025759 RepID=UPI0025EC9C82|nr:DEAD/DEAH box helicase [uncultured Thomasclavelia sp.]
MTVNLLESKKDILLKTSTSSQPRLLYNNYKQGMKISHELIKAFDKCDSFVLSIAFINLSGLATLKQTLIDLKNKGIKGKIITSTYLNFNEPKVFKELLKFDNLEVRIYHDHNTDLHSKGYIFKKGQNLNMIIGSSNLTQTALSVNQEWNMEIFTDEDSEISKSIKQELLYQWQNSIPLTANWIDEYARTYQKLPASNHFMTNQSIRPNKMQIRALQSLEDIRKNHKDKALIISATGTGKTYLSAFDVKNYDPKRMLFVVHRENIALAAMNSYKKIISNHSFGMFTGNQKDTLTDYIFATIQTIHKKEYREMFLPDAFDYIVIDEVHRAGAASYQELVDYFKPRFLLGMSATPERSDNFDIYKMFDYNIAYEIRLQQAMEYDLLCPFHYYGISDITVNGKSLDDKTAFNYLVSNHRVDHIIEQINIYGYSGDRVRGLIFCSRKEEAKELSKLFNQRGYKTIALTGEDSEDARRSAMDKLETNNPDDYLDYIFTVDIFNEGIDIPKVNQIVMLRPTQSAIIFVQQLGRGLRKHNSKEYVVIIDFIANYEKNFLIPIALSGNLSYNKDNLRRFVSEGSLIIPGASTVSFDQISKKRIFESIDKANFSDVKIIKEAYFNLKQKLGRIPKLQDFDTYESIDVLRIFQNKNLGCYHKFLSKYEKDYQIEFNNIQEQYLAYISTKLASGKRIHELEALKLVIENHSNLFDSLKERLKDQYNIEYKDISYDTIVNILSQNFATGSARKTFKDAIFIDQNLNISSSFKKELTNTEFKQQILEVIDFGISRYQNNYANTYKDTNFCLYEKYTYEDVCRLLNWQVNAVPLNIGGYKYDQHTNTMPVFINHDLDASHGGKYQHQFIDAKTLICFSKPNRSIDSEEIQRIYHENENHLQIHLFVRKNKDDAISKEFYYFGQIHAINAPVKVQLPDNKNSAIKFTYQLENEIRQDIYDYITSNDDSILD